jgi:tRNA nucleotidyltransferase/poly(A) polymerase
MEILKHPDLQRLNNAFSEAGFELRIVGGSVRDLLLGVEPKDIDLCTTATPDQMQQIAKEHSFTFVATGLQHGTATFVLNHVPYEITTLRIDTDTDGRHATVEFTADFEKDAARRDITFNAMYLDFDGIIHDYFGGEYDLMHNLIKFVGNAEERITEDGLRILRFFRFSARFGSEMDIETLDVIRRNAALLDNISRERIWLEMSKLLVAPHRYRVLAAMTDCGIISRIGLPAVDYHLKYADSAEAAIASFFPNGDQARRFCNSWKMSLAETNYISWVAQNFRHPIADIRDWINGDIDRRWIMSALILRFSASDDIVSYAENYEKVTFPVQGKDLIDLGIQPGPEMGRKLSALKKLWIQNRYTLTKQELLEYKNETA